MTAWSVEPMVITKCGVSLFKMPCQPAFYCSHLHLLLLLHLILYLITTKLLCWVRTLNVNAIVLNLVISLVQEAEQADKDNIVENGTHAEENLDDTIVMPSFSLCLVSFHRVSF